MSALGIVEIGGAASMPTGLRLPGFGSGCDQRCVCIGVYFASTTSLAVTGDTSNLRALHYKRLLQRSLPMLLVARLPVVKGGLREC